MRTGQVAVFDGYLEALPGCEPVFLPGDLVVVSAVNPEGDLRCHALSWGGGVTKRSDMVWPEEVLPLNNAPLIFEVVVD